MLLVLSQFNFTRILWVIGLVLILGCSASSNAVRENDGSTEPGTSSATVGGGEKTAKTKWTQQELGLSSAAPGVVFYAATSQSCCGEDPHAVHGIETPDGGFVLAGKSLDSDGEWQGFAVKFPAKLPSGTLWLDPEEGLSYQWAYVFGSDGVKDGANAVSDTKDAVFVAGFAANAQGRTERFLAKLDLANGNLIWKTALSNTKTSGESAFESLHLTKDEGLVGSGFVGGRTGDMEGFKSYGNPQSGKAFVLRLRPQQVSGSTAPQQPEWEQVYEKALSGKTVKELSGGESGFVVATSTRDDKHVPVVLWLDAKGELLWSKSYPDHGELTDIAVLSNQGWLEGLALSGHRKDAGGGIDGVMTKLSLQGDVLWSYNYGNPQGGVGPFRGLGAGNPRLIYDECWGIQSMGDGGAVMACGTGIEECEPFEDNDALYDECTADPRKTWRSLVVRVNPQGGPIWHRTDSYRFPGEPEEEQAPATASEFVLVTSGGQVASITDLSSGIGLQLLERE